MTLTSTPRLGLHQQVLVGRGRRDRWQKHGARADLHVLPHQAVRASVAQRAVSQSVCCCCHLLPVPVCLCCAPAGLCMSICVCPCVCVYLQPCGSGVLTGGHAPHVNSLFTDFRLTCNVKLVQSEMHSGIAVWGEVPPPQHGEDHTYAGHLVMFPSSWSLVRCDCLFLARPH